MSRNAKKETWVFLAVMLAVLPTAVSIGLVHFHPPFVGPLFTDSNWQKIQLGMTKSEVWLKLGQPDIVRHRYDPQDENWTYDGFLCSYEVTFDAKTGTVSNWYYDDF